MTLSETVAWIAAGLIALRLAAELWLSWLNRTQVQQHASAVPEAFRGVVDDETYRQSVAYTLARSRFGQWENLHGTTVLALALFSGALPLLLQQISTTFGNSAWAMAAFLFLAGVALSIPALPVEWLAQFRLEERFGFNTTTPRTWCLDRVKGFVLAAVLGYPLLVLILKIFEWTGSNWWLWAWGALMAFQFLMLVLAPVLIMPLFNKFTPLAEGPLKDRLLKLAERTRFRAQSIQIMDGSKRSKHSNAFFTGFGRFRKIVLFDTLMQQLSERELEAVLAHEIGHYRLKHIPKMLLISAAGSCAAFYAVAWLAQRDWFYRAFGFEPGHVAPALLLFALLASAVTFWLSPLANWLSRKHEYEADAFARKVMNESGSLIGALRKLNEKNLSNLTPHPLFSGFHYSHPTLLEREAALRA